MRRGAVSRDVNDDDVILQDDLSDHIVDGVAADDQRAMIAIVDGRLGIDAQQFGRSSRPGLPA